jgi:amino-acid N-acetyltransferase
MSPITLADREDLPAITKILTEAHLPLAGLDQWTHQIVVAREDDQIIGCAAWESYGLVGLLRSIAVRPRAQGQHVGQRLVEEVMARARQAGIHELYLLTETAANYFLRWGFQPVTRAEVNLAIHQSVEWTDTCPASAQVLHQSLSEIHS